MLDVRRAGSSVDWPGERSGSVGAAYLTDGRLYTDGEAGGIALNGAEQGFGREPEQLGPGRSMA